MARKHSDATTGPDAMLAAWFNTQQQLWNQYVNVTTGDREPPWASLYQQSQNVSKQLLSNTVEAQSQWAHQYIDTLAANGGQSEASNRWAHDMSQLVDQWADAERQLCDACLPAAPWRPPFIDAAKMSAAMGNAWRVWLDAGQTLMQTSTALAAGSEPRQRPDSRR